jgi:hypothetical protein
MSMKTTTIDFILENILVDPLMTDRSMALLLEPKADLFWAQVKPVQVFHVALGGITDMRLYLGLMALFSQQSLSLFRAIAKKTGIR